MTAIKRYRLKNGLTVLAEQLHQAPVVALQTWVNVGSADETPQIAGIAHLHEHMLFKGTKRRAVGEIARAVEASGGEINAWTSFDQTVYHVVLTSDELETGVDLLADVMQHSAFDPDELAREIEVVVEEIQRAKDSPARRISQAMFELCYQAHPYRHPVLGTEASVRGMTRAQIVEFYRTHYRPDNVTLVVVGDFQWEQLERTVETYFGAWQAVSPAKALARTPEPIQQAMRVRILREDVKEARVSIAWHIPGLEHPDIAAIDALALLLGYGDSSKLYIETRRRLGLVNDVHAHAYTPRDPGLFMVGAGLRAENIVAAYESLLEQTYSLRFQSVAKADLEKVKVLMLSEAAFQKETMQGQARKLGFWEVVASDYRAEDAYTAALKALTPQHLQRAAERYLNAHPNVVVQLPLDAPPGLIDEAMLLSKTLAAFEDAVPVAPIAKRPGALGVTQIDLKNGARLLLLPEESPVFAVRAAALGGMRYESAANNGLSNLVGTLLGLSTQESSPSVFARRVALLGGSIAAFSGRNTVGLRGDFVGEKALDGLALFLEALRHPMFGEQDLERERAVILERIRNRDDNPASVCFELFCENLYPHHPYGLPTLGTEGSLAKLGVADVEHYHSTFLRPDNLVICAVGPFNLDDVVAILSEHLTEHGQHEAHAVPPRDPPLQGAKAVRRVLDKKQTHIFIGGMGTTLDDYERHTLEVLTTVLSGQSGRLFTDLRDKQSLAYSVSGSNLEGLDPGHLLVHIGTSPEKETQAKQGIYAHIARLRDELISDDELARAKRYLIGNHAIDLQRPGSRAMTMALHTLFGMPYDEHARYADAIKTVTAADVMRAAQKYWAPHRLLEVAVGPAV